VISTKHKKIYPILVETADISPATFILLTGAFVSSYHFKTK